MSDPKVRVVLERELRKQVEIMLDTGRLRHEQAAAEKWGREILRLLAELNGEEKEAIHGK